MGDAHIAVEKRKSREIGGPKLIHSRYLISKLIQPVATRPSPACPSPPPIHYYEHHADVSLYLESAVAAQWPPMDPTLQRPEDREAEDTSILLAESPWTYTDGSLNPNLRPTSAAMRRARKARAKAGGPVSSLPPYHPDYQAEEADDAATSSNSAESSDDYYEEPGPVIRIPAGRVRRGSEGYEVRPINREEMLTRYIAEQVGEEGRYNVYVPEPDVDSESDDLDGAEDEGDDEDMPLANKVQNWRAGTEVGSTDL